MFKWTNITRKLASWGMAPRTRLARFTLYLAGMDLILLCAGWAFRLAGLPRAASPLDGWTKFITFVVSLLFAFLALRWFRRHIMWSVRNRLIVTYLFIGGVPVTLAMAMAIGGGLLMLDQLATFFTVSEIHKYEQRLQAANSAAAEQILRRGDTPEHVMAADALFPGRTISVLPASSAPAWLKTDFSGLTNQQGQLFLRAATSLQNAKGRELVISTVPVNQKFLAQIASRLGWLSIPEPNVRIERKGKTTSIRSDYSKGDADSERLRAGSVPPPQGAWDKEFRFGGLIQTTDWTSGSTQTAFLLGATRLSTIYSYLTGSMELWTGVIGTALVIIAVAFGVVILIALLIGVRLTRTLTYSVASLYKATQHINRGDFEHRIEVRQRDQLGALQTAFNSMTESLQKLIAEQKEKERLQSELEIAHEVQEQLFPRNTSGTQSLEVYGVCHPARTVSGDYYDFLSYGPDRMGIAVGDISGKGISAALLMATIHSAVRAYEQEQMISLEAASAYGTTGRPSVISTRPALPSPAQMLWLLNRHLFRSTQPEKYATLFLGFYDGDHRRLTYSNGGHLAPIILGQDGSVRRLEAGGMVVGLFDNMEYQQETVEFQPGDIFIAFSDGMTEPENEFGEYGEDRLIETISANRYLPLERICSHAIAAVKDWIGAVEQPDDITLVLARRVN
ncbi:MAG: PP2C family protein-serine/threonine phosphatase [Actinomycetota bacterium]